MTFADKVIQFNNQLHFDKQLPDGIAIMNPFELKSVKKIANAFYHKYYNDNNLRYLILGINPGRFGGGLTGIPFTDPKRLKAVCGIPSDDHTHEPSSDFIYQMIDSYGGPEKFYSKFYINSVCPLGFVKVNSLGKQVNYNYYDSAALTNTVKAFIIQNIAKQIAIGVSTEICFCLGTGDNYLFLKKLNDEHGFFKHVQSLAHPRYVMQYKSKTKQVYIDRYLNFFNALE